MGVYIFRFLISLILGIGMTAIFSGILNKKNLSKLIGVFVFICALEMLVIKLTSVRTSYMLYPIHTHLMLILSLIFIFGLRVYDAIFFTLLAYQACAIPAYISKLTYYIFPGNLWIEYILYTVIAAVILVMSYQYIGNSIKKMMDTSIKENIAYGILPITYYFFDYASTVYTSNLYSGSYYYAQFMPFMVCITYMYFILFLQRERKRKREALEEKSIKERDLAIVENEVRSLRDLQEMARIYRHDIRHHFALISSLLMSGNTSDAVKYINENLNVVENVTPMKYCDLEMLNLLILEFADKAKNNHIDYKFDIALPEHMPLSNMELCALTSSLWTYAFDKQLKLDECERYISMSLGYYGEMFAVFVDAGDEENPVPSDENSIKSIEALVNKYDGMARFDDNGLILKIIISIPVYNVAKSGLQ